jgi:DNA-binding NarL/FixJ family response regulator
MTIQIFLADDHAILRDGLRSLLETYADLRVVGEAADGRQTVQQTLRLHPEVVVMDIVMPELNGIEAAQQIRQAAPASQVIILSMYATTEHIQRAFQAGARGYVLKESVGTELVEAIRTVHAGRRYLSPQITDVSLESLDHLSSSLANPLDLLSAREREVLQLVVEGQSSAEIAVRLSLSPKTVETYRVRLMRKLNLRDLPALIRFSIQHGLTPLQ